MRVSSERYKCKAQRCLHVDSLVVVQQRNGSTRFPFLELLSNEETKDRKRSNRTRFRCPGGQQWPLDALRNTSIQHRPIGHVNHRSAAPFVPFRSVPKTLGCQHTDEMRIIDEIFARHARLLNQHTSEIVFYSCARCRFTPIEMKRSLCGIFCNEEHRQSSAEQKCKMYFARFHAWCSRILNESREKGIGLITLSISYQDEIQAARKISFLTLKNIFHF